MLTGIDLPTNLPSNFTLNVGRRPALFDPDERQDYYPKFSAIVLPGNYTVSISEISAVPGPMAGAGLPGLIIGFAGLGFMAYRRKARSGGMTA